MGGLAMTELTPDARRDAAIALVLAAGGVVLGADPLADPADPSVVVAYRLRLSAPDPAVLAALDEIQTETEIDTAGLIPWADPIEDEEES